MTEQDRMTRDLCCYLRGFFCKQIKVFDQYTDGMSGQERNHALVDHLSANLSMALPEAFPALRGAAE